MVENKGFSRICLLGGSVFVMLASIALPSTAQAGFFDQLFGAPSQAPYAQPSYDDGSAQQRLEGPQDQPVVQRRAAKRVSVDEKPVLQKTTDLMHDKTLHPGDAVMMKSGMHVYAGRDTTVHKLGDFVRLDSATRLKPVERVALASLDGTRNDPLAKGLAPDTVSSGRSAAVSSRLVAGVKFTDQRGKTIRYVGP